MPGLLEELKASSAVPSMAPRILNFLAGGAMCVGSASFSDGAYARSGKMTSDNSQKTEETFICDHLPTLLRDFTTQQRSGRIDLVSFFDSHNIQFVSETKDVMTIGMFGPYRITIEQGGSAHPRVDLYLMLSDAANSKPEQRRVVCKYNNAAYANAAALWTVNTYVPDAKGRGYTGKYYYFRYGMKDPSSLASNEISFSVLQDETIEQITYRNYIPWLN